jgi:hypothetical protein
MWTWTKVAGRALINLGVVILGIVAAKELVDAGSDIVEAFQSGSEPMESMDSHPFPPMA